MAILEPGQQLGVYQVGRLVGRGGMAEVYQATHVVLERSVAIKVLNRVLNADPTFPLRFLREAKAVARLNHPNIVTIHDFDEKGDLAYLVMELAEGGTLRDQVATFHTLSEAIDSLLPVCAALEYAHQRGIVHRDVKPINVLLDAQGRPMLADFGLARVLAESRDDSGFAGAGSPYYMAPEQALGKKVDQRADIYALGIVTYELVTGSVPYRGATAHAIIHEHLTSAPPSVQRVLPAAPSLLDATIRRATSKQPAERFASAAEFAVALQCSAAEAPMLPIRRAHGRGNGTSHFADATVADPEAGETAAFISVPGGYHTRSTPGPSQHDLGEETLFLDPRDPYAAATDPGNAVLSGPDHTVRRPRPFLLGVGFWPVLGGIALLLTLLTGLVVWLTAVGRAALAGTPLAGPATALYDHRAALRVALAAFDLALGITNATLMRIAVLSDLELSLNLYRNLRQSHRLNGYITALVAIAVEGLLWTAVLADHVPTGWAVLALGAGTVLLVTAVGKVGVVRYLPPARRYLPYLGIAVLTLLIVVLAATIGTAA